MPTVTIIIPHYNDLAALDLCLNSLLQQDFSMADAEIIVADNASPQGLDAVALAIAGRARLVLAPERGAGPARNSGVAAANAPLLAFIDCDCVAEPRWLTAGIEGLEHFDLCGGPIQVTIDTPRPWTPAQAFEMVFAFDNESYVRDKGFTVTANLFTRRDVFDAVGGFGVGMSEDLDWSHRARAMGYRLGFVADAVIGHPARRNWDELRRKWLRIQSETYALHPPTLANRLRWLARSWAMPLSILPHLVTLMRSPRLHTLADRVAAARGLIRLRLWRWWDSHRLLFGLPRE